MNKCKTFAVFVVIIVVLTGAGFGALTGLVYSKKFWLVGMITGTVGSYPLAMLYLKQLAKISAKGHSKKMTWLLCTIIAVICGIICTTLIHGMMTLIIVHNSDVPLSQQMDGFWSLIFLIGEGVGAGAGLLVGGICSLIYVLSIQGKNHAAL